MDRAPAADLSIAQRREAFAREMAAHRMGLVFGGGGVGLMGHVADAMLPAGGHAIGVIPDALIAREIAHCGLPDLRVVHSMHERKAVILAPMSRGTSHARFARAFKTLQGQDRSKKEGAFTGRFARFQAIIWRFIRVRALLSRVAEERVSHGNQ